jgi:DNA repair protein RecO (recombination protein O)
VRRIETPALLVRSVPLGESDLVVTFFTKAEGKLSAMVRGARRSQKRFGGALEPIHGLAVRLADRGKELCSLEEARVERPRSGITGDLARMDAAGHALRWVRHLCPPRTPEPGVWDALVGVLDALDVVSRPGDPAAAVTPVQDLAAFGLRLLAAMGYALDLSQCVSCGKPCPRGRSAFVDAARGGLVCTTCGGARRTISADLREAALALSSLSSGGRAPPSLGERVLTAEEAGELVDLVEEGLVAHASFESAPRPPARGGAGSPGGHDPR